MSWMRRPLGVSVSWQNGRIGAKSGSKTMDQNTVELLIGLAVLAVVAWMLLSVMRKSTKRIPKDYYGYDGHAFYPPGTVLTPLILQLIDVRERVSTPSAIVQGPSGPRARRCIVTWRPDPANLAIYLRYQDVEAELQKLYAANPEVFFRNHEKTLGIRIVHVEQETRARKKGGSVSLGEDVEIPY